jgi:hypothetical protein
LLRLARCEAMLALRASSPRLGYRLVFGAEILRSTASGEPDIAVVDGAGEACQCDLQIEPDGVQINDGVTTCMTYLAGDICEFGETSKLQEDQRIRRRPC